MLWPPCWSLGPSAPAQWVQQLAPHFFSAHSSATCSQTTADPPSDAHQIRVGTCQSLMYRFQCTKTLSRSIKAISIKRQPSQKVSKHAALYIASLLPPQACSQYKAQMDVPGSMLPVKSTKESAWRWRSCQFSPYGSPPQLPQLQIYPETCIFSENNIA